MRRWPLLLLTASGLAFLASLYLPAAETFLIPLALLALVILWLIGERAYRLNWGGRIVVAVLLVLALLGWPSGFAT